MFRPGIYDSPENPVYSRAKKGLEEFAKIPIEIADDLYGFDQIRRFLLRRVEQGRKPGQIPVGLIVIDYMQLISNLSEKQMTREREVSSTSRGLKQLSGELGVPLAVLSSFNRVGLTDGVEPDVYNLRDSGSIAFDAEAVILLHNPSYIPGKPYIPKAVTDYVLIGARQRNGPSFRTPLKFIGKYMQFMTESQYARAFGDISIDKEAPKSSGQMITEARTQEAMWEIDDDDL